MANIEFEAVPDASEPEVKEYLHRLVNSINVGLYDTSLLPETKVLPKKPTERKIYFFSNAAPPVTEKGYWFYTKDTNTWTQLGADSSIALQAGTNIDIDVTDPSSPIINAFSNLGDINNRSIAFNDSIGWNMSITGPADKPTAIIYTKGQEIINAALTWNASDNVSQTIYTESSDGGSTYPLTNTLTITYDVNDNVTATGWT